ncbi:hypothetical protein [Aliarcobacter vitoriensis]|uniref:Uncharacterized protein n=1 Tax=Aliarcobacter vitoriensis TaxID=2011099 RepID=A0A366MSG9_9BACT|nr:hypothetical protein [Aliarcobacter vitoriensis]RBQ29236.1 hypothetical protein CRU91_05245 [Aliarcobacter vitoriensis]
MNLDLKNKKILYIGQKFFGYEQEIINNLQKLEATVDFFDERPSNKFWYKLTLKLNLKNLLNGYINTYYNCIINKTRDIKYDYIFINKLESINYDILSKIKNIHNSSFFILYKWDSVKNYKPDTKAFNLFDKKFTFDSEDAQKYDNFKLLPLFYIDIYKNIKNNSIKYDMCFIGSGHSDRYLLIKKIKKSLGKDNIFFTFFYLGSKLTYLFRKIFDKRMKKASYKEFSFESLSQVQVVDYISKSNIIIDIEHPTQTGLTMRTIEMLGAKKKLVTTNKSIKKYDFYHSNNIFVIDRNNPIIDKDFIEKPYIEVDKEIYDKYYIRNWLIAIFDKEG